MEPWRLANGHRKELEAFFTKCKLPSLPRSVLKLNNLFAYSTMCQRDLMFYNRIFLNSQDYALLISATHVGDSDCFV